MKSHIKFADLRLKKSLEKLKNSKTEDKLVYKWINRALDDIEKNAFCSIQIPKRLIPKKYIKKYKIDNLWKYDMPRGWRLLYTVINGETILLSVILEWFDHKEYEKRFKY